MHAFFKGFLCCCILLLAPPSLCLPTQFYSWANTAVTLHPYEWRYFRVDIPVSFSSVTLLFTARWSSEKVKKIKEDSAGLMMCFRVGGPPLPSETSGTILHAASLATGIQDASNMGHCSWFQESVELKLSEEEVPSGAFYIGVFNNASPIRTQSKMISKGNTYTFGLQIIIYGCCNQVSRPSFNSCWSKASPHIFSLQSEKNCQVGDVEQENDIVSSQGRKSASNQFHASNNSNFVLSSLKWSLHQEITVIHEWKYFKLFVDHMSSKLEVMVYPGTLNQSNEKNTQRNGMLGNIYTSYGMLPDNSSYQYMMNISSTPLSIVAPKIGWWYIGVRFSHFWINLDQDSLNKSSSNKLYFVIQWRIPTCSIGRSGTGCMWPMHPLERLQSVHPKTHIDSYYRLVGRPESVDSQIFSFNSSLMLPSGAQDFWNFFFLRYLMDFLDLLCPLI